MKPSTVAPETVVGLELFELVMMDFRKMLQIRSEATWKTYRNNIRLFLKYLAERKILKPDERVIFDWTEKLLAEGRSPATINNYLASLRAFFCYLERLNKYPDITKGVKNLKAQEFVRDYFSADQLRMILSCFDTNDMDGLRNFCIISLMASTGLRSVSIAKANVEDLGEIAGEPVLFYQGKGRSDRREYVKIAPELVESLTQYLTRRGVETPSEPLFLTSVSRGSHRMSERSIRDMFKRHCERLGIQFTKNLSTHSLRASFIIQGFKNGVSLEHLREVAGHKTIEQTAHYARSAARENNMAENTVWDAIWGKTNTSLLD